MHRASLGTGLVIRAAIRPSAADRATKKPQNCLVQTRAHVHDTRRPVHMHMCDDTWGYRQPAVAPCTASRDGGTSSPPEGRHEPPSAGGQAELAPSVHHYPLKAREARKITTKDRIELQMMEWKTTFPAPHRGGVSGRVAAENCHIGRHRWAKESPHRQAHTECICSQLNCAAISPIKGPSRIAPTLPAPLIKPASCEVGSCAPPLA